MSFFLTSDTIIAKLVSRLNWQTGKKISFQTNENNIKSVRHKIIALTAVFNWSGKSIDLGNFINMGCILNARCKNDYCKNKLFFQFLIFTEKFLDFNHCKKYFEITALYSAQAVVRPRANVFFLFGCDCWLLKFSMRLYHGLWFNKWIYDFLEPQSRAKTT